MLFLEVAAINTTKIKKAAKTLLTATSSQCVYPNGHLIAQCDAAVTEMLKHNLNKWSNNSDRYFSTFLNVTISEENIKYLHGAWRKVVAEHSLINVVFAQKSQHFHI